MNESFYRAFEDRHRGSRELVKSRLKVYLPFIRPLTLLYQPAGAIDLGCGRGEWLELLGETGFDAYGVDLDAGMLSACYERGLNVQQGDALKALHALPTDSIALVSAFHVVEHMPFEDVRSLVREALRVLQPGGLLILETPNPENLVVGTSSFYLDPSHLRPIPTELLSFVVEHAGFLRNKVLRLQEAAGLRTASNVGLFDVLNGVSPDYGIIAQKNTTTEILSGFDEPFAENYGVSLGTLAHFYDLRAEHIEDRLTQSEAHAMQIAVRAEHIEDRLTQSEAHAMQYAAQMAARAEHIEDRLTQSEAHAAQVSTQLFSMLHSRSWRITAPLRFVAIFLRRIRTAILEKRLLSGAKRRIKSLLCRIELSLQRRSGTLQTIQWVLNRFPAIKYRLRRLMRAPSSVSYEMKRSSKLSPRAANIYAQLKKAIDTRRN